jgi:PadR family transcriptional regulator AphA
VEKAPALSLAEWIVLALIDESPRHGFAVAAITAIDGDIGRAWQVPRPIVYRSADRLTALGLVRVELTQAGNRGPQRSILTSTPAGTAAVADWLTRPVEHVRDIRSELLVKLALLVRRGVGPDGLICAQRAVLAPVQAALEERARGAAGFGQILAAWRVENVRAAMRFLDRITVPAAPPG